jgi:hypothetical protein
VFHSNIYQIYIHQYFYAYDEFNVYQRPPKLLIALVEQKYSIAAEVGNVTAVLLAPLLILASVFG